MQDLRYLPGVTTLKLNTDLCIGCGQCALVCPHSVFVIEDRKARIIDMDGCMECGACDKNCPVAAVTVTPGVGCATYIIQTWFKKKESATCC
jgi:ferredoxin